MNSLLTKPQIEANTMRLIDLYLLPMFLSLYKLKLISKMLIRRISRSFFRSSKVTPSSYASTSTELSTDFHEKNCGFSNAKVSRAFEFQILPAERPCQLFCGTVNML